MDLGASGLIHPFGPGCWDAVAAWLPAEVGGRLAAAKARRERLLWQLRYLAVADAMTWKQFENYGVELLRGSGYRNIEITAAPEQTKA